VCFELLGNGIGAHRPVGSLSGKDRGVPRCLIGGSFGVPLSHEFGQLVIHRGGSVFASFAVVDQIGRGVQTDIGPRQLGEL